MRTFAVFFCLGAAAVVLTGCGGGGSTTTTTTTTAGGPAPAPAGGPCVNPQLKLVSQSGSIDVQPQIIVSGVKLKGQKGTLASKIDVDKVNMRVDLTADVELPAKTIPGVDVSVSLGLEANVILNAAQKMAAVKFKITNKSTEKVVILPGLGPLDNCTTITCPTLPDPGILKLALAAAASAASEAGKCTSDGTYDDWVFAPDPSHPVPKGDSGEVHIALDKSSLVHSLDVTVNASNVTVDFKSTTSNAMPSGPSDQDVDISKFGKCFPTKPPSDSCTKKLASMLSGEVPGLEFRVPNLFQELISDAIRQSPLPTSPEASDITVV